MPSVSALVELAERYAALGLPAAARGALRQAADADPGDATAARRLAELALAAGEAGEACIHARDVVAREPGAAARVLLGRAQLAAGEVGAARFSFAASLEAASQPLVRARAHLGLAAVAMAEGDRAGAGAHAMAGLDQALVNIEARLPAGTAHAGSEPAEPPELPASELALLDELLAWTVETGRASDASERIDELAGRRPDAPVDLLIALLLAARQARGDSGAGDLEIERALARAVDRELGRELGREPGREPRAGARALRLRLVERRLGRRLQDRAARAEAIEELDHLAGEVAEQAPSPARSLELAHVCFLRAAAHEDDPGSADQAEALYRQVLTLQPGHVAAANRLARIALARGDADAALTEVARVLRVDPGHGWAWRNAARLLDISGHGPGTEARVARLLDAASPGTSVAAAASARLMSAAAEVARDDLLAGMYARGHRVKNLLGIIGARARSARKLAEGALAQRLSDLEHEVTALYDEWTLYLRSMRSEGPVIEVISTAALLAEVIEAAATRTAVPIALAAPSGMPDLRGDRVLLREALLNIVSNAAEACESTRGRVDVSARATGATPTVEIEIADAGPGIPRADLGRVFAPGFTTKESGSGIGLAIAERVVSAHHGRIRVDSEPGRGTRVTVVLPCDLGGFATLARFARSGGEGA